MTVLTSTDGSTTDNDRNAIFTIVTWITIVSYYISQSHSTYFLFSWNSKMMHSSYTDPSTSCAKNR